MRKGSFFETRSKAISSTPSSSPLWKRGTRSSLFTEGCTGLAEGCREMSSTHRGAPVRTLSVAAMPFFGMVKGASSPLYPLDAVSR